MTIIYGTNNFDTITPYLISSGVSGFPTSGNDIIYAYDGNDTVDGGSGVDYMDGGAGIDTLDVTFWNSSYVLNMTTGATNYSGEVAVNFEKVYTGNGSDTITGNTASNEIKTNGGNDKILGGDGNDSLYAGDGNDTVDGGYNVDYMDGGAGIDTLDVTFWNSSYVLNMTTGATNYSGEVAVNFEKVYTGNGSDTITGSTASNEIKTNGGNDKILGGDGNDSLYAGDGNDTVDGGYNVDYMDGGAGIDTLDVTFWNSSYVLNMTTGATNYSGEVAVNFEKVYTGNGSDTITGSTASNEIKTNGGNDKILGGDGNDSLYAGDGNDTVDGGYNVDYMDGGAGIDTLDVTFWNSSYVLNMTTGATNYSGEVAVNFEKVYTGNGSDTITGNTASNEIKTNGGNDKILGGDGNDSLYAGDGNDTVDGGYNVDYMDGGAGIDTLDVTFWNSSYVLNMTTGATNYSGEVAVNFEKVYTGNGSDTITGNTASNEIKTNGGNDSLSGYAGNDDLFGGDGNDILNGGEGNDLLEGSSGTDSFVFNYRNDSLLSAYDVITDYTTGERIDAPSNVIPATISTSSGRATSLSATNIAAVLTSGAFPANSTKAFTVSGQSGTFLAFNDGNAGFNSANDSIVQLQGYTLGAVTVV